MDYAHTGSYDTGSSAFVTAAQSINFTLNWNESNGAITGIYQDNYFAPKGVTLSGAVVNGAYKFTIPLAQTLDGVQSLVFDILTVNGALEASVQGKGTNNSTVFAAANIALKSVGGSKGGTAKPADVSAFFSQVAGTYKWIAKRTGKADATFTVGKEYSIVIGADKKVTLPKDDGTTLTFTYGEEATDSFEAYDHEAYIIVQRDGVKILVQHHFAEDKKTLSYEIGSGLDGTFWSFSDATGNDSPAETGNLGALGAADAVGIFSATISSLSGTGVHLFKVGDVVSFEVDADGNITGDFGEYKYGENTFVHMLAIQDNVEVHQMNWFDPNKTAATKNQVQLYLKEGKFTKILFTVEKAGVGTYHYATLKE